mmetsp:Transcript_18654/g.59426  ORF Transcript_18654/g.59426 Transcript_18654/m.59426 type:complete len:404 (-) Transcript_18654:160-1371(-)
MTVSRGNSSLSRRSAAVSDDAQRAGATEQLKDHPGLPGPFPLESPPFTVRDLRAAVPKHCFERSYATSFYHLFLDLFKTAALYAVAVAFDTYVAPHAPGAVWWLFYLPWWYATGSVLTGVWVLAHECGHHAFSPSEVVNDVVGYVLHTALLVPYHSWRVTHGKHHSNTGSLEHDEVFVPTTRAAVGEHITESPLFSLLEIANMLLLGWPAYLIANASGPAKYKRPGVIANHFHPGSAFFTARDWAGVVVGAAGVVAGVAGVCYWAYLTSVATVTKWYIIPYLIVNLHLVLITYLQHTDVFVPHFRESRWTWLHGAMCTVDRSFGSVLDHTFHRIADLHVCHHLFSRMPFYHHEEATKAMLPILGKYYMRDTTPIPMALWRAWTQCKYVEDEGDVVMYKRRLDE